MTVNAFWFGFLIGMIALVFLIVVIGILYRPDDDTEMEPISIEDLRKLLNEERKGDEKEDDDRKRGV